MKISTDFEKQIYVNIIRRNNNMKNNFRVKEKRV